MLIWTIEIYFTINFLGLEQVTFLNSFLIISLGAIAFIMVLLVEIYLTIALYGYFMRKLNAVERLFSAIISCVGMYTIIVYHAGFYPFAIIFGLCLVGALWVFFTKDRIVT
jgi:hypothetical protein